MAAFFLNLLCFSDTSSNPEPRRDRDIADFVTIAIETLVQAEEWLPIYEQCLVLHPQKYPDEKMQQ